MKNWWKVLVRMALPLLLQAGEEKQAEDENTTGKDDAIGISLVYVSKLLAALVNNKELPKAPPVLR